MIGWAGAASKHMEKYAKIYNDKVLNVVSICPPFFHFKVPNESTGKKITPIMEKIPKENPIVIHSFSMNGIRGLISLSKATGNPKMMDNINGIIFDSAPSLTFPYQNGKAMMLSRPSSAYLSDEMRSKMYELCNSIRDSILSTLLKIFPSLRQSFLYWYIHDRIQLPKRQLYFYSHRDSMVPFGPLEEFMEIQRRRGCHVESINFGETEHVAHFRDKPEEYSKKCIEFVSKL
uniref:Transmembrane protein 53 n=1 Tax=Caenorhabditis tropicalis TaxID=1561998 RepID=A0A1I7TD15_9PELO